MAASNVEMSALLEAVATTGKEWSRQEPAAREKLLSLAHSLVAALETPSDFVHRIGIAEVFFHLFVFYSALVKVQNPHRRGRLLMELQILLAGCFCCH